MKCEKCGKELLEGSAFCDSCGNPAMAASNKKSEQRAAQVPTIKERPNQTIERVWYGTEKAPDLTDKSNDKKTEAPKRSAMDEYKPKIRQRWYSENFKVEKRYTESRIGMWLVRLAAWIPVAITLTLAATLTKYGYVTDNNITLAIGGSGFVFWAVINASVQKTAMLMSIEENNRTNTEILKAMYEETVIARNINYELLINALNKTKE